MYIHTCIDIDTGNNIDSDIDILHSYGLGATPA